MQNRAMIHTDLDIKIEPFTVNLKDGTEVLIREGHLQDAADLIRCIRTYVADSEFQVMEPDEFAPDLSQGREFIQSFTESENSILLVAIHNEKVVGNLDITGGKRRRLRHTGLVGMGMLRAYRSKGLGKAILEAGIKWAKEQKQLDRLWLQILAGNEPAIKLYEQAGFIEEGRQKDFIKIGKGQYQDNVIMYLNLRN
jgi:RimJ/RimL family protein N-acetyltransferase